MSNIFFISDTHLGHKNILNFTNSQGEKLRPFYSLEEMHTTIRDNWNRVVKPQDKVYHLGDVAFGDDALKIIGQCNGHKRLIRGNHDLSKIHNYLQYFEEVYGVRQINGYWLSHVPMHLDSVMSPRCKANIHGHLHANKIDHPKYFNASVECINYTPIHFDEVKYKINKESNGTT